jgi:hypothetical protein
MKSVSPLLDGGLGVFAYYYDLATPPPVWFSSMIALDVRRDTSTIVQEMLAAYSDTDLQPNVSRAHVIPSPLETISEACKAIGMSDLRKDPIYNSFLARLDAGDMISLRTIEESRCVRRNARSGSSIVAPRACGLGSPRTSRPRVVSAGASPASHSRPC